MKKRRLFLQNNSHLELDSDSTDENASEDNDENKDSSHSIHESKNLESESDSTFRDEFFNSYRNGKLPYTREEDEIILKFILKGQNIFKTTSISLWKQLETKKEKPFRTYQSLKNRFLRNIRPNIFIKFRHLVQDKETTKKIISKFPELQRTMRQAQINNSLSSKLIGSSLPHSTPGNRPSTNDQRVRDMEWEIPNPGEQRSQQQKTPNEKLYDEVNEKHFLPVIYFPGQKESNSKCVEYGSDKITVTFRNNLAEEINEYNRLGIYQKYLALKSRNSLTKCEHCGRGEPDSDPEVVENPESRSECPKEPEKAENSNPVQQMKLEPMSPSATECDHNRSDHSYHTRSSEKRKTIHVLSPNHLSNSSAATKEEAASKRLSEERKQHPGASKRPCKHKEHTTRTRETRAKEGTGKSKEFSDDYNGDDGETSDDTNSEGLESLFQNFITCGRRLIETDSEDDSGDDVKDGVEPNQRSAVAQGEGEKISPTLNVSDLQPRKSRLLENILDMLSPTTQAKT